MFIITYSIISILVYLLVCFSSSSNNINNIYVTFCNPCLAITRVTFCNIICTMFIYLFLLLLFRLCCSFSTYLKISLAFLLVSMST